MGDVTTLTVRGEGGAVFDMDVPEAGTPRREVFDDMVRKGQLVILEGEIPNEPNVEPDGDPPSDLASLKVDELKALADELGIDLGDATKKADIVDAIENATSDPDDDEDDDLS